MLVNCVPIYSLKQLQIGCSVNCGLHFPMRIDYGPGYRVYFVQRGYEVIILLAGDDKASQARDIKSALKLARDL
ncbi:hypothetical protein QQ992_01365 [Pseudomonas kurunegalensis]|nr:type II toxin-antitoxin system RelE/ParE family toxin [Pseudomonas kurunegalensis]WJD62975.1 hypothetical protein QQ992_01365 [Pseudomonas kurunegalensis]